MNNDITAERTRTPDLPMAFTFREFLRGVWAAWGIFLAILLGCLILVPTVFGAGTGTVVLVVYGMMLGGGISLVAVAAFSPVAWALGWCLRRTRSRGAHLVAFAVLGTVVGLIVGAIVVRNTADSASSATQLAFAIVSAVSVALGWRHTAKRALNGDDSNDHLPISVSSDPDEGEAGA